MSQPVNPKISSATATTPVDMANHTNNPAQTAALLTAEIEQVIETELTNYEKKQKKTGTQAAFHGLHQFNFGAPPAPNIQINSRTLAGHKHFAKLAEQAMLVASNTEGPLFKTLEEIKQQQATATPIHTAEEAANTLAHVVGTSIQSGRAFSQNTLVVFMKLILHNNINASKTLQHMAHITASLQSQNLKEQQAQAAAAELATKKAHAKIQKMAIAKPILAALTAVVTAVAAVATLGMGVGLAIVATAMVGGFLWGGLHHHDGQGFHLTHAFNNAAMAGGIASIVVVLPAVVIALTEAGTTAMVQLGMQQALQAGESVAVQTSLIAALKSGFMDTLRYANNQFIGSSMVGKNLGRTLLAGSGIISAGSEATQGAMQYAITSAQLQAETEQAMGKILQAANKIQQTTYETINDMIQEIMNNHQNAVKVSQNLLKTTHDTNLAMANKL